MTAALTTGQPDPSILHPPFIPESLSPHPDRIRFFRDRHNFVLHELTKLRLADSREQVRKKKKGQSEEVCDNGAVQVY